jgi:hypothetical protein
MNSRRYWSLARAASLPSAYDDPNGRLIFQIGHTTGTITIDNVPMQPQT